MLRLQTSYLHQSKEIIRRWCKNNFYDDEYNISYPNTSMVVCLGKEASKTKLSTLINHHAKRIESVAKVFKEMITELEEQVDVE